MNPTEGSQRERRRLERATRRIKSKFFRKTNSEDESSNITHDHENASFPLEQFLKEDPAEDTHAVIEWLHTHEKIYVTEKCRRITPEHESHGEFLIAKDKLYYVGNEPLNECFVSRGTLSDNAFCKQWPLENIKETLPRWFGLRDCALEMFMADGQAEMLAFETTVKRDGIINLINASLQNGSSGTGIHAPLGLGTARSEFVRWSFGFKDRPALVRGSVITRIIWKGNRSRTD